MKFLRNIQYKDEPKRVTPKKEVNAKYLEFVREKKEREKKEREKKSFAKKTFQSMISIKGKKAKKPQSASLRPRTSYDTWFGGFP